MPSLVKNVHIKEVGWANLKFVKF